MLPIVHPISRGPRPAPQTVLAFTCLRLLPHDAALDLSEAQEYKAASLLYWKNPNQAMGAALKQQLESTFFEVVTGLMPAGMLEVCP